MDRDVTRRNGRGSNQYRTLPGSAATVDRRSIADVAAAVEDELRTEQVGLAFDPTQVPDLTKNRSAAALKRYVAAGGDKVLVVSRKRCPPDLLTFLAFDESPDVRGHVAEHVRCPPDVLAELVRDSTAGVGLCAAKNSNCPPESVDWFARRRHRYWNMIVEWDHTPPETLRWVYTQTRSSTCLSHIAANPNTPRDVLEDLVDATTVDGHHHGSTQPLLSSNPDRTLLTGLRNRLLTNPNCPPRLFDDVMVRYPDNPAALAHMSRNPSCPTAWLTRAVEDETIPRQYAIAAAANPSLPVDLLRKVIETDWRNLGSVTASTRRTIPDDLLCVAAVNYGGRALVQATLLDDPPLDVFVAARRGWIDARRHAARHPRCDPETLDVLVRTSEDTVVQQHVIKNPNVSISTLRWLADHGRTNHVQRSAAQTVTRRSA